jgi:predicted small metal-binding protein
MRDLQCPCGTTLTGADDEELLRLGREHADSHHPNDGISDDFIRNHIATGAVDAVPR